MAACSCVLFSWCRRYLCKQYRQAWLSAPPQLYLPACDSRCIVLSLRRSVDIDMLAPHAVRVRLRSLGPGHPLAKLLSGMIITAIAMCVSDRERLSPLREEELPKRSSLHFLKLYVCAYSVTSSGTVHVDGQLALTSGSSVILAIVSEHAISSLCIACACIIRHRSCRARRGIASGKTR